MNLNQNLAQTEEYGTYKPLPPDEYRVRVVDDQVRETRAGENRLTFTYEVIDGPYAGRQIFDGFSLWSSNPKAVSVAQSRLKSLAIACRLRNPNFIADSSEMLGKELIVRTAIREHNGSEYEDIKKYMADGTPAAAPQAAPSASGRRAAQTPPPPPAPAQGAALPWE